MRVSFASPSREIVGVDKQGPSHHGSGADPAERRECRSCREGRIGTVLEVCRDLDQDASAREDRLGAI